MLIVGEHELKMGFAKALTAFLMSSSRYFATPEAAIDAEGRKADRVGVLSDRNF